MKDENGGSQELSYQEIARQQLEYSKKQYQLMKYLTGCTAALLIVVVISSMVFYHRFDAIYKDLVIINANMKEITTELADLDLKNLSERLESTLDSSEKAMDTISETISKIALHTTKFFIYRTECIHQIAVYDTTTSSKYHRILFFLSTV